MASLALASSRVPSSALAGPTSGSVRSLSRAAVPRPAVAVTAVTSSCMRLSIPAGSAHLLRRSSLRVPTAPTPRPGATYVTKYRPCAGNVGGDARADALLADIAADLALVSIPTPAAVKEPNLLDTFLRTLLMRSPFKDAGLVAPEAAENNIELENMADPPTPPDAAPFAAVATARVALATAAARLAVFSRRMRLHMLQLRSVRLSDRAASLAMLRLPMPAQLAQLATLSAEHAAALLATMEEAQRDALLRLLDATQRGAELSSARPKSAAANLQSLDQRMRLDVLMSMPRVAALATVRHLSAAVRTEVVQALRRDAREAWTDVLRRYE